jgi:PAS domain S-box-containing protein
VIDATLPERLRARWRAILDADSPLRTRWFGEQWPPSTRWIAIVVAFAAYALAFAPLYGVLGLGATALAALPVVLAAGLLGLGAGLVGALLVLPLHTLLLNLADPSPWDPLILLQRGRGTEAFALLLVGGAVGWLRDLARRVQAQARELGDQRDALEDVLADREEAEGALRESEARFRAVVDGAGAGIAVCSLLGLMTQSNPALERMLGYRADELRGRVLTDVIHPDDAPAEWTLLRELAQGRRDQYRLEQRYVRQDGRVVWGQATVTLVRYAGGSPRLIVVMIENVTEVVQHRQRREALLRAARRLAAASGAEAVLTTLVEEAAAVLEADAAAVFRWDAAANQLAGLHATGPELPIAGDRVLARAAAERQSVVIDDYASSIEAVPALVGAGVCSVVAVPLIEQGQLLGVLWVASQRPEQRLAREDVEVLELLVGIAAAEMVGIERARLAGVLLAARTAQHEVNNRLAATVGFAELLAEDPALPPHLRKTAADILDRGRAAAQIVDQIGRLTDLQLTDWGSRIEPTIDLGRSASR